MLRTAFKKKKNSDHVVLLKDFGGETSKLETP